MILESYQVPISEAAKRNGWTTVNKYIDREYMTIETVWTMESCSLGIRDIRFKSYGKVVGADVIATNEEKTKFMNAIKRIQKQAIKKEVS